MDLNPWKSEITSLIFCCYSLSSPQSKYTWDNIQPLCDEQCAAQSVHWVTSATTDLTLTLILALTLTFYTYDTPPVPTQMFHNYSVLDFRSHKSHLNLDASLFLNLAFGQCDIDQCEIGQHERSVLPQMWYFHSGGWLWCWPPSQGWPPWGSWPRIWQIALRGKLWGQVGEEWAAACLWWLQVGEDDMLRPAPRCPRHQAEEDEEVDVGGPDQVPPHLD